MIVVSDASPIRYLILVDSIHVLFEMFGTVVIPPGVFDELSNPGAPELVRNWIEQKHERLQVLATHSADATLDLGVGETAAILLAKEIGADAILIDDTKGRKAARQRNLKTIGTLGVLLRAHELHLIDFECVTNRLLGETNFRVSEVLLAELRLLAKPY